MAYHLGERLFHVRSRVTRNLRCTAGRESRSTEASGGGGVDIYQRARNAVWFPVKGLEGPYSAFDPVSRTTNV